MVFFAELINPNVSISAIMPELVVALAGIVVMLYDSFVPNQRRVTGIVSLVGLAISAVLLGMMWSTAQPATAWNGMIAHDNLRMAFSFVFLFVSAMTILISTVWVDKRERAGGRVSRAADVRDVRDDADGVG